MNVSLGAVDAAIVDCVARLRALPTEKLDRAAAMAARSALRAAHPQLDIELSWRCERLDQQFEYDVVLSPPGGGGAVLLTLCPRRDVPWSLRGLVDFADHVVVRVNGEDVDIHQAAASLETLWADARLARSLVDGFLLRQELKDRHIAVDAESLQKAMDQFRAERGLESELDLIAWSDSHGVAISDVEYELESSLATERLEEQLVEGGEPAYFEKHRAEFERVAVMRRWFPKHSEAHLFSERMQCAQADAFLREVHAGFLSGQDGDLPPFFRVQRGEVSPEAAIELFGVPVGTVTRPVESGNGWDVFFVNDFEAAHFDAQTARLIRRKMVQAWLDRKRQESRIEWFWGPHSRSPSANGIG